MQNPLRILYPNQCIACGGLVESAHGLCGACWTETPFISGLVCDGCSLPLIGEEDGLRSVCDECMTDPPPWDHATAIMSYRDTARRMVLQLKHGDRLDLVRPAAKWMAARASSRIDVETCLVPVPLHWTRLLQRRFNQSAALAKEICRLTGAVYCPDSVVRIRRTRPQEKMTREERRQNLEGAIRPHPRQGSRIAGRAVVLVDDVMTSGATLRASAMAAKEAGARSVSVLVLARVVKDG
jgi:ComF family protein